MSVDSSPLDPPAADAEAELAALRQELERERAAGRAAEREAEQARQALHDHQRRTELVMAAAIAANDAPSPAQALETVIETVRAHTGWSIGHAFVPSPADPGRLVTAGVWAGDESERCAAFRAACRETTFARGEGLPGRVFASGRPEWHLDLDTPGGFVRREPALGCGLNAAFAFPVLAGREVVAVLEFFAAEATPPDSGLLAAMGSVGVQLGRVFERERSERRLVVRERLLAEAQALAHIGSWTWTPATNTLDWSDELHRIFGLDPARDTATFDLYARHLHPEDRDRVLGTIASAVETREDYAFVHRLVRPDGSVRYVQSDGRVYLTDDGQVERLAGTAQDITDAHLARLEREAYARRLEQTNRELQEFAYVASHDLQEPLRKVRLFADMLATDEAERLSDEGRRAIERMRGAAERMSRLISDLLSLSRISTRPIAFVPVDLGEVVDAVLTDLDVRIEDTGGEVVVEGTLPTVDADRVQMGQVFQNLIANALKYHRPDVPPRVHVHGEVRGTEAIVTVRDNGLGFDAKYAERIFGPFQRLQGRSDVEGTGMGLSIVRRVLDRHNGHVTAESTPGQGSTFTLTLPLTQPVEASA